ncbi:hypothetical protein BH09MYX1_BH09MYX1_00630 [soil metagenome]
MTTPGTNAADLPHIGGPLDGVNEDFHTAYYDATGEAEADVPVFVLVGDQLVVFRRKTRREISVTPRLSHVIKSVAHAPVGVFSALEPLGDDVLDTATRERLEKLLAHTKAALSALATDADAAKESVAEDLAVVLSSTTKLIENAFDASGSDRTTALWKHAKATGPLLLRLTAAATRVQLAGLDEGVAAALAGWSSEDRRRLQVVVTGDHQARSRSLGMQYFRRRLGELDGAETRVAYAEGVTEPDQARALVGKRRVDAAIAKAFFGDGKRLQRDILGDAASMLLATRVIDPI